MNRDLEPLYLWLAIWPILLLLCIAGERLLP